MKLSKENQYIRSIELLRNEVDSFNEYPLNLQAICNLHTLTFHPNVTFIVGENGTGKSTILEGIAVAYGFNPEGGTKNFNFSTNETHSELHKYIKLVKSFKTPKDGFFLRAESFYNVATQVDKLDAVRSYGGKSLHEQSHGESFFSTFMNRFGGNGIYILDEPEAALSPSRQMALLSIIHDLVQDGSQFIIATHSPIIMAYPDATIFQLKEDYEIVKYEDTDHYMIMKDFLNNPKRMLEILMEP